MKIFITVITIFATLLLWIYKKSKKCENDLKNLGVAQARPLPILLRQEGTAQVLSRNYKLFPNEKYVNNVKFYEKNVKKNFCIFHAESTV
jgi:hypothetical protein